MIYGAVKRIRPKIMTVGTTLFGLIPILFSQGIGADVMKRIAAPMVGGGHHLGGSGIDHLPGDLPHTEEEGDGIE